MAKKQEAVLTLSKSCIGDYTKCERLYYWGYERLLKPVRSGAAVFIGSTVHVGLEALHSSRSTLHAAKVRCFRKAVAKHLGAADAVDNDRFVTPEGEAVIDKSRAIANGLVGPYVKRYAKADAKLRTLATEKEFEWELHPGVVIRGKIDWLVAAGKGRKAEIFVVDHKTTSRFDRDYVAALALDREAQLYAAAAEHCLTKGRPVRGVIYNIIKKPGRRLKKDQTWAQYTDELASVYAASPDDYFHREEVLLPKGYAEQTEIELAYIADNVSAKRRLLAGGADVWIQAKGQTCTIPWRCPFISLCVDGESDATMMFFTNKAKRHEELS